MKREKGFTLVEFMVLTDIDFGIHGLVSTIHVRQSSRTVLVVSRT
jgi:Tfp pilus assembly major pilin PilA